MGRAVSLGRAREPVVRRNGMGRVMIVSNRLPVSVSREDGALRITRSAGGLATGLAGVHSRSGGLWLGWPGVNGDYAARDTRIRLIQQIGSEAR